MQPETIPLKEKKRDVYQIVTDKIIAMLEQGTVPWHKPWMDGSLPRNLISKRPYRGINLLLLASLGYEQNLFLTFNQVKALGGKVKKGEHAIMVVFWNFLEPKARDGGPGEDGRSKKKPILRYYFVFNIAQCEDIPEKYLPDPDKQMKDIPDCRQIVEHMPNCPSIRYQEQMAYYNPVFDFVNMPNKNSFDSPESYYATLFHELTHSTGHQSRLNRRGLQQMTEFGSEEYSHEELVAEIGTCYLLSMVGIAIELKNSVSYIAGWLKVLKNDRHFIFSASSHAQKATDYILDLKPEGSPEKL